jgi:hypothetical protein
MNLWESYQQLSPLTRVIITLGSTVLLVGLAYWCNKWIKKRAAETSGGNNNSKLIIQQSNGVFYVYIAYWRFIVMAIFLSPMLYVLVTGFIDLYQDLPKYFWQHWSKQETLTLIVLITILLIATVMVHLLIKGYKAVQLEIGKDYVRFRKRNVRGGIMLSSTYIMLKYSEIVQIDFHEAPLIGYVLSVKTANQVYRITLLLSPEEKVTSYRILDEAASSWQKKRSGAAG